MAFNYNQLYTIIQAKMKKSCKVGRYIIPQKAEFPFLSYTVSDISGGNYDLENNEGSQNVMVILEVYDVGSLADSTCYTISEEAKKLMLSYGFQCRGGPMKVNNADPNVARWVGRYQRIFADGDELTQIN